MKEIGLAGTRRRTAGERRITRRDLVRGLAACAAVSLGSPMTRSARAAGTPALATGAERLATAAFGPLAGKRLGLLTNHTGRVGDEHLADLLATAKGVQLAAIFAPEHGFRGTAEAGATVEHGRDRKTGAPVLSLYGATRKPTPAMLRDIDVLVFDIQDVGARFYTYISTMGLVMQAAAAQRIPFVVLDRPNPIGGEDVAGFVLEPSLKSFVGQYPMPIVHGMTVGEIARMIKGERWLEGVESVDLTVIEMTGWTRAMRWPSTGRAWVPTSPNVPTFLSALVYPGMGLVGETLVNEGRGTPSPFLQCGAPWLDGARSAARLDAAKLPGVRFEETRYTPRAIPNVAADPRFRERALPGVRLVITDAAQYRPVEAGMHVLAELRASSKAAGQPLFAETRMFHATSGTRRLHAMLERGADGKAIVASWQGEVERFRRQRAPYLIY
jgi:uncharacterized protein YbbC (DUF1343 family)